MKSRINRKRLAVGTSDQNARIPLSSVALALPVIVGAIAYGIPETEDGSRPGADWAALMTMLTCVVAVGVGGVKLIAAIVSRAPTARTRAGRLLGRPAQPEPPL